MNANTRLTTLAFGAVVVTLLVVTGFQYAENSRMKAVLIERTLAQLERDYEVVLAEEERNVATLRSSLTKALQDLSALRGLSAEESNLIETAISLTDQILEATTSKGISLE